MEVYTYGFSLRVAGTPWLETPRPTVTLDSTTFRSSVIEVAVHNYDESLILMSQCTKRVFEHVLSRRGDSFPSDDYSPHFFTLDCDYSEIDEVVGDEMNEIIGAEDSPLLILAVFSEALEFLGVRVYFLASFDPTTDFATAYQILRFIDRASFSDLLVLESRGATVPIGDLAYYMSATASLHRRVGPTPMLREPTISYEFVDQALDRVALAKSGFTGRAIIVTSKTRNWRLDAAKPTTLSQFLSELSGTRHIVVSWSLVNLVNESITAVVGNDYDVLCRLYDMAAASVAYVPPTVTDVILELDPGLTEDTITSARFLMSRNVRIMDPMDLKSDGHRVKKLLYLSTDYPWTWSFPLKVLRRLPSRDTYQVVTVPSDPFLAKLFDTLPQTLQDVFSVNSTPTVYAREISVPTAKVRLGMFINRYANEHLSDPKQTPCSICYDPAELITVCGHRFCDDCYVSLMSQKTPDKECPMCKGRLNPLAIIRCFETSIDKTPTTRAETHPKLNAVADLLDAMATVVIAPQSATLKTTDPHAIAAQLKLFRPGLRVGTSAKSRGHCVARIGEKSQKARRVVLLTPPSSVKGVPAMDVLRQSFPLATEFVGIAIGRVEAELYDAAFRT